MKVSLSNAKKIGDKLGVDFNVVDIKMWQYGMQVELEHGYINPKTNVTNDNLLLTGKIALAHILEFPDYYIRLQKLEAKADTYWSSKKKPKILKQ